VRELTTGEMDQVLYIAAHYVKIKDHYRSQSAPEP
jgi:hypothetical protein